MNENESCGVCRFWEPLWRLETTHPEKKSVRGGCHRHAPRSSAMTQSWPMTDIDDWCGEYELNRRTDSD